MKTAQIAVLSIALGAGAVAAYLARGGDDKAQAPAQPVAQLATVEVRGLMPSPTTSTTAPLAAPLATTAFDVPAATFAYLARSATSLREAITSADIGMRYAHAHVAALRATAALLAARAQPTVRAPRRGRPVKRNAWS